MNIIYKENGLNPVRFPWHTPTWNIKELYNRLLRTQAKDEEAEVEEGIETTNTGDSMEVEMVTERGREPSLSPAEIKDKKKKKIRREYLI